MKWLANKKGEIVLNTDELYFIKEFKDLIRADRGSDGDHDGRKKFMAFKKLAVLWYIHDVESPGVREGKTGDELFKDALLNADLPADWKPDRHYIALERFILKHQGIAAKSYKSLIKALSTAGKVVDKLNDQLQLDLATPGLGRDSVSVIVANVKDLVGLSGTIAGSISNLRKAEESAKNEKENLGYSRGGGEITKSMIPPT